MKYINKLGIVAMSGFVLGVASCTDFADYNTSPDNIGGTSDKTLWENIESNADLSQFASIIEKSGFSETLNSPRFYTVFAPKNGSFNADSVLELDKEVILKEFVKQHIVEYNHPVNSAIDEAENKTLLSLNTKSHSFTTAGYGDAGFTSNINVPASNGVMHIVNHNEGFYNSIYEYLDKIEGCDMFRNYIKQYDEEYIDEANSILGPTINGEQTYEYVEYAHRNNVINRLMNAKIENEDSSYTVLFPNDEAWTKSYDRISKDLKFIPKLSYMDFSQNNTTAGASIKATDAKTDLTISAPEYLTDSLTKANMVCNLAFSHGYSINDVLLNGGGTKADSVFSRNRLRLVSAKDVEDHTLEKYRMSNGYVRVVDSIPFQPWQTFEPIHFSRNVGRVLPANTCQLYYLNVKDLMTTRDTLFKYVPQFIYDRIMTDGKSLSDDDNFYYVSHVGLSNSAVPELDFIVHNLRSTTYHIYVVTAPDQLLDDGVTRITTNMKKYYLNFYLNYTDADNVQKKVELKLNPNADPTWGPQSVTEKIGTKNVTSIVTEPGYVNVIDLGEFTFPVSYLGLDAYPNLMMCHTQTFNNATKRKKYEQYMRVAGVFFFPVEADTYYKNYENGSALHKVNASSNE